MKYVIIIMWLIPGIILGGTLDMIPFYGDNQRWWVGTVEENSGQSDLNCLGRTRVRIDGIHGPDISLEDLPYAQCILPTTGGGTSGSTDGTPQLLAGARVIGFFLDGAGSQIPVIWGFVPHIAGPTIFQEITAQDNNPNAGDGGGSSSTVNTGIAGLQPESNGNLGGGGKALVYANSDTVVLETNNLDAYGGSGQDNNPNAGDGGGSSSTVNTGIAGLQPEGLVVASTAAKKAILMRPTKRPIIEKAKTNVELTSEFFDDQPSSSFIYEPHHIAAIIGNFIHESGSNANLTIDTEIFSGVENEISQGIAQWNEGSGRLAKLRAFALRHGYPHTDLLMQLKFVDHELRTYTYLNDGFFDTTTVEQATMHFLRFYLRPTWCSTGKQKQRSAERINVTSKLNAKTGLFETNTCVYLTRQQAGGQGNSTVTDLFPFADGGKFPAGSRNFIRSHEHRRVGLAEQIYNLNLTRRP